MKPRVENIYDGPKPREGEECRGLYENPAVKIERIVSRSHPSPPGFWYDQDQDEWVMVLKGRAVLEFEDEAVALGEGDYLTIPKHARHRVRETSDETIWLAVHAKTRKR